MRRMIAVLAAIAVAGIVLPAHKNIGPSRPVAARIPKLLRDHQVGIDAMEPKGPEQGDTQIEPSIAVNPENAKNAVTCYQEGRVDGGGDGDNGCATTFDGGKTWSYVNLPGLTKNVGGIYDRASDAVVAFGPNNYVYANSLVFDDTTNNGLHSGIVVNISPDGGKTWGNPITVEDDQAAGLNDKNWIVVDNSKASGHHYGRVYVVWDRIDPVVASYSDDNGQTWTPPSVISPSQGIGAIPLVTPAGDLVVVLATDVDPIPATGGNPGDNMTVSEAGMTKMVDFIATGAGSLVSPAALDFTGPFDIGTYYGNGARVQRSGDGIPTAAIDPKDGTIYVAWNDARKLTKKKVQGTDDIVWTSSPDGINWPGTVKRINPPSKDGSLNHFTPAIGVAPDGTVQAMYRQRKESNDVAMFSRNIYTYYRQLRKGAKRWSKPLRVDRVKTDVDFAAFSRNGAFLGDYNQIAPAPKFTYVVRCEALPLGDISQAAFPPKVHHQRTWVAVVKTR